MSAIVVSAKSSLSSAALVVYALALALGLGVSSAYFAVSGNYPFGEVRIGPWETWPQVGSIEADPYARTIVTRTGEVPLALGEGLTLIATIDTAGRALDSSCTYRVEGTTPQARLWTLTLYDRRGALISSELGRSGFASPELLRNADGRFVITLSREARPGNWLQLPPFGGFSMALRLYDTPVAVGSAGLTDESLPSIERLECGA
jgi:hypothetical protein